MKHYVYTLARPDGRVFYVGKGVRGRIHKHEWAARNGEQSYKANIIRKIWAEGGQVVKQKVFESDNEQEALAEEIRLIAYYGRENLTNLTDGGDVNSGWKPKPETTAKIAASLRGRKRTAEECRRISESLRGRIGKSPSEEVRRKIAESQTGKPKPKHSEEERRRKSERQKGRKRPPVSEETRQKLVESHKGKKQSPEQIEKRVASIKENSLLGKRKERSDKGRKRSNEVRQKIIEGWKRRKEGKLNDLD